MKKWWSIVQCSFLQHERSSVFAFGNKGNFTLYIFEKTFLDVQCRYSTSSMLVCAQLHGYLR